MPQRSSPAHLLKGVGAEMAEREARVEASRRGREREKCEK